VSNFEQPATAKERILNIGMPGHGSMPMSETDQFWQYAKEALLSACYAKTDEDKKDLLDLAQTWTQAALQQRKSLSRSQQPG
jgi:hypothetical protein